MKTTAWMLALTSLTCWNAMAQNLVSNPDFEIGNSGSAYAAGSTALSGWTVDTTPSDGVQHYFANILGATQTPNTKVLQLTGGSTYAVGGGVQQSIATTDGVTYTISIDVANRQNGSVTGNFSFGGQNQTLTASSKTFTTRTWTVTASSASTLIDITGSTTSGSAQLLIDNVSVTPPAAASAANSTVTAAPADVPVDGTSTITVTLLDDSNIPVAGKTVTLAHTAGPGTPTINTISGVTNGTGVATFTVASTTAGAATFTATDVTDGNLAITETATVNFLAVAPIAWGGPTTIAGDSDVSTTGTLNYAYHWNTGDQTVNGVTFTGTTSVTAGDGDVALAGFGAHFGGFIGTTTPFTGLSADYQATLAGSPYNGGGNAAATLKNLTPGNQYAVQIWCHDARSGSGARSATLTSPGGNSVTLDYNSSDANGGVGQYSIGSFTAASSLQTITIANNGSAQINALQVRDITGVVYPSANATNSTVTAAPDAVPADGTTTSTITVTLLDDDSIPAAGKTVTLAQTAGPGTPTINTISGITGGTGVATFTVASTTAGTATFTATDVTDGNLLITETATVTFFAVAPITWGTPITIADDTDVSTAGTLKYAYHWAAGDQTVNGVTFTGTTSFTAGGSDVGLAGFNGQFGGFTGSTTPFTGLSVAYQATLAGSPAIFTGNVINATVTLKNLTPGNEYAVQVWSEDARGGDSGRLLSATLTSTGGNSVVLDYNSTDVEGGVGQYSIGTFIAASEIQTFTTSSTYPLLNALQVRDLTAGGSLYDTWANGSFVPALTQKLRTDNQDSDAFDNLQEFAFGTQPTVSTGEIVYSGGTITTPGAPKIVAAGEMYSIVFGRRDDYLTAGLTYTVQFSANLDTWADNNDTINPPVQVATDGTINAMSVPFPDSITTTSGTQTPTFSRVRVVLAP